MAKHSPAGRLRGVPPHPKFRIADLDDDALLTRAEMCAATRTAIPTAELWAKEGRGPPITRMEDGQPRYRAGDVRRYMGLKNRPRRDTSNRATVPAE